MQYIWLIFVYEVFGNLLTEFARQALLSPAYNLSELERKLWKGKSVLSTLPLLFLLIARVNGIVFLVYLGFRTVWWHPVALWIGCLVATVVAASLFRGRTGLALPAVLGFAILPIAGVSLWLTELR